jgi:hypothetical protein
VLVFHHIPRTGGTFLGQTIKASPFAGGPMVHLGANQKWVPDLYLDRVFRPVMLCYHCSGAEFAHVFDRRPGDFVFTFLRDRVDMVYSNYAYMRRRVDRGDALQPWATGAHEHFARPLEEHVDALLASEAPDHEYPPRLDLYDFVGVTERMTDSLAVLSRVLGTPLPNDRFLNHVPVEKVYRRADLERKYARERALHAAAGEALDRAVAALSPESDR